MVHKWGGWINSIFVCIFWICVISVSVGADHDLTLSDIKMKVTVNNLETLSLGTIPPEGIAGSVLVLNKGDEVSPPFNIAFSLVSHSDKERTVDLISRPGGAINPGSSEVIYLTTARPVTLIPGKYYLKGTLVIDGVVKDSLISSDYGSLGGGTQNPSIIPIYKGYRITKPGYYLLQQDIAARDAAALFQITCDDVILDGNGFTIFGPAGARGDTSGVLVSTGTNKPLRRVTIKNMKISGFTNGIWLFDVANAKVLDTHISKASKFGIRLDRIRSSTFSENIIENCLTGIGVFQSQGNTFTNNMLKNQNNVIVNEKMKNKWSIDPVPGKNVLGGEGRGGNVWLTPDGSGFSVTARDSNANGFTDMSFAIDADNIDYHPLVYRTVFVEQISTNDETEDLKTEIEEKIEYLSEEREQTQEAELQIHQEWIQVIPDTQNASDILITNQIDTQITEEIEPIVKRSEQTQEEELQAQQENTQVSPDSQEPSDTLITNQTDIQIEEEIESISE